MESHKVKSIVAIWVTAALLAACGGGDGSSINTGGSSTPVYATWSGSSNNDVIMDANNERFGVRLSDRTVVADNGNIALTGLTVDEQGNIYRSGQKIGTVSLVAASDGSQIAAFKNLDGSLMDIQISNGTYLIAPSTTSGGNFDVNAPVSVDVCKQRQAADARNGCTLSFPIEAPICVSFQLGTRKKNLTTIPTLTVHSACSKPTMVGFWYDTEPTLGAGISRDLRGAVRLAPGQSQTTDMDGVTYIGSPFSIKNVMPCLDYIYIQSITGLTIYNRSKEVFPPEQQVQYRDWGSCHYYVMGKSGTAG